MSRTTCPDCNEELQPIKIIDATRRNPLDFTGLLHVELSYSSIDAKPGFFYDMKKEGTVQGRLCPKCGRILLYAGPS